MKKKLNIIMLIICLTFLGGCAKDSLQYVNGESNISGETVYDEVGEKRTGIRVHICGEVYFPGVYLVDEASRVCDVVQKAGGFTEEADKENVNQAKKVSDGERIYIPSVYEGEDEESDSDCVNINKADVETLCTLPGIGKAKAKQIVEYRKRNGDFQSIEDIMNVAGIKEGLFSQIAPYITVS